MVALGVINAQAARSLVLMEEYRELHQLCTEMDVELSAVHASSALNAWADRMSREKDSTDWTLLPAAFTILDREFGPHFVDRLATELTTRCRRVYLRRLMPGALGVDALAHDWPDENAWANRPFHLVGAVEHGILATKSTVTLVAPAWRAQSWWAVAVAGAWSWCLLPRAYGVSTHGSKSTPAPTPFWRTAAFRFCAPGPCARRSNAGGSSSPPSSRQ